MRPGFLLIIYLFLAAITQAQTPFTREYSLNESGIPVKVNDLLYDPSGYLWLATDNGLYRFNGRNFTLLPDSVHQPVTAVAVFNDQVYTGYKNGKIGCLTNGTVRPIPLKYQFPSSSITSLHAKGALLWVTTEDEGIFLIMNDVALGLTTEDGLTDNFIYDATIAPDEVMVATDRGINHVKWHGKKPYVEVFTTRHGLPDNIVRVLQPIPDTRLCWIGTQEGGVALFNDADESIIPLKFGGPWAWGQVNGILPLGSNKAWIATDDGYLLSVTRNKDSLTVVPYSYEGLKFRKIIKDKAGNIWCATNKGLFMSTALYAEQIRLPAPYQLRNVTALSCDGNNNLWFAQNKSLYKLSVDKRSKPEHVLVAAEVITAIFPDDHNHLWFGTYGKGLFCYSGGKVIPVGNIPELNKGNILSITGVNNSLWVTSLNGVEETVIPNPFRGSLQWIKHHNKLSGTGSDYVYQVFPDHNGRIWMATDGAGVCMYDGKKYHLWDSSSGLRSQVIYAITEDAFGNIWAGASEKGLFRLKDEKWENIKEAHGLQNKNITSLQGNASGQVIIVHEEGIDQWCPSSSQFRHYNRKLGIDIDSTSQILNCIARDRGGSVFVPFEHGFLIFKNHADDFNIRPDIDITGISLFFKPLKEERHLFRHNENHISFRFDGINFSNPEKLHYRYKLEGYDNNWIYTNDEVVSFPQLAPRSYLFRVQASLNNYFTNAAEDNFAFNVDKPFWKRTWFVALVSLSILGAGYGYVRVRERGLRKMSRLQKERMVFEYEHLKSQVNPHFLFNSLNTLVSLIEEDREAATDYTVHLSDLYRNMLSYKDQDLILLSEEHQIIENYMYIQKSRFGEALQLRTDIPPDVLKTKRIVPLALQLLVENAIKHNVVSLSRPLTIFISANEQHITVRNTLQPKQSKEKGAGLGLVNIKKRYGLLTSRGIKAGIENNEYIVTLPLL